MSPRSQDTVIEVANNQLADKFGFYFDHFHASLTLNSSFDCFFHVENRIKIESSKQIEAKPASKKHARSVLSFGRLRMKLNKAETTVLVAIAGCGMRGKRETCWSTSLRPSNNSPESEESREMCLKIKVMCHFTSHGQYHRLVWQRLWTALMNDRIVRVIYFTFVLNGKPSEMHAMQWNGVFSGISNRELSLHAFRIVHRSRQSESERLRMRSPTD